MDSEKIARQFWCHCRIGRIGDRVPRTGRSGKKKKWQAAKQINVEQPAAGSCAAAADGRG